jgi:hypothetical protein
LDVGDNYMQHSLMHIDSHYLMQPKL